LGPIRQTHRHQGPETVVRGGVCTEFNGGNCPEPLGREGREGGAPRVAWESVARKKNELGGVPGDEGGGNQGRELWVKGIRGLVESRTISNWKVQAGARRGDVGGPFPGKVTRKALGNKEKAGASG